MLDLVVPERAIVEDDILLQCIFDLEGEKLYSVKWYKDEQEFFRCI